MHAIASEELGTHSSHDTPQVENPPPGQESSSEHNKASTEQLENLSRNAFLKAQSKSTTRTKAMAALGHQIRRRIRESQAIKMGLPAIPHKLIDKSHLSQGRRQKNKPQESIRIRQAQRIEDLRRQRDSEQNPERRRLLQVQLNEAMRRLRYGQYEDSVLENIKAGKNPAELAGPGRKGRKATAEQLAEMEMEFKKGKNGRKKSNLRPDTAKQDGSSKEGKSANEKIGELQVEPERPSDNIDVKKSNLNGEVSVEKAFQDNIESGNGGDFDRFMQDLCAGDDSDGQNGVGNWGEI
ncbi:hypothetical protein H0H93_005153 [Arthromyces matolae]|nr:hypothetical protein H0H93_005153 [Arthromyces matolae]